MKKCPCHLYTIGIHAGNLYGAVVETAEWCSHTGGVMVNKYVVEDEKKTFGDFSIKCLPFWRCTAILCLSANIIMKQICECD